MARQAVVDAVAAHLAANWSACDVVVLNTTQAPPAAPFLEVQFPVANTARLTVSDRLYREEGAARFVLSVEAGTGTAEALQWADQIADLFRDRTVGGVRFLVPSSPDLADFNDDGSFFVCSVVAPYTYDFAS